jgi:hypothetical protein
LIVNTIDLKKPLTVYWVSWVGYHDGLPAAHRYYARHFAEQFAFALRMNGVNGVQVTKGLQIS